MLLVYAPTVGRFCLKSNTWNRSAQHTLKIANGWGVGLLCVCVETHSRNTELRVPCVQYVWNVREYSRGVVCN
jgi:hypothetical protein